ncbi:hypothetical protein D1007_23279 [Hordeum vulgare]|nr:hypothetical protein D1007_23279 [Hordeum vulgare]
MEISVPEEGVSEDGQFQREGELRARNREAAAKLNMPWASEDDEEDEDKHVSEDDHAQIGGGLQGMKREVTAKRNESRATEIEIKNEEGQDYVQIGGWEQERKMKATMLRLQIVSKTEELEAKQIRRLELELHLKTEENKSLKKQNEELRADNEYYRKTL